MSWSKGELINEAFAEISLAASVFDLQPEEQETALRRLDTMMATWVQKGARLGYSLPSSPDASNLDDDSGLPDWAIEAVYLNLAIRLAPGFGKTPTIETKTNAKTGYDSILWAAAHPIEQQLPSTMPRGAGNKPWRRTDRPFMPKPDHDPLQYDSQSNDLDILPE